MAQRWAEEEHCFASKLWKDDKGPEDIAASMTKKFGKKYRDNYTGAAITVRASAHRNDFPKRKRRKKNTTPKQQQPVIDDTQLRTHVKQHAGKKVVVQIYEGDMNDYPPFIGTIRAAAKMAFGAKPARGDKAMPSLKASQCRWPVGNPLSPEFCFCSAPIDQQHAGHKTMQYYCKGHAGLVSRLPKTEERKALLKRQTEAFMRRRKHLQHLKNTK